MSARRRKENKCSPGSSPGQPLHTINYTEDILKPELVHCPDLRIMPGQFPVPAWWSKIIGEQSDKMQGVSPAPGPAWLARNDRENKVGLSLEVEPWPGLGLIKT